MKQVWITQADSGDIVQGRLVSLSPDSLALLTPDNRRVDIPLDRVLRVETGGDSLKNGAAIGALVRAAWCLRPVPAGEVAANASPQPSSMQVSEP